MFVSNRVWMEKDPPGEFDGDCGVCWEKLSSKPILDHKTYYSNKRYYSYKCAVHEECYEASNEISKLNKCLNCMVDIDPESRMSFRSLWKHRAYQLYDSAKLGTGFAFSSVFCICLLAQQIYGQLSFSGGGIGRPYIHFKQDYEAEYQRCYAFSETEYWAQRQHAYDVRQAAIPVTLAALKANVLFASNLMGFAMVNLWESRPTKIGMAFDVAVMGACSFVATNLCFESAPYLDLIDPSIISGVLQAGFLAGCGAYTCKKIEQWVLR